MTTNVYNQLVVLLFCVCVPLLVAGFYLGVLVIVINRWKPIEQTGRSVPETTALIPSASSDRDDTGDHYVSRGDNYGQDGPGMLGH